MTNEESDRHASIVCDADAGVIEAKTLFGLKAGEPVNCLQTAGGCPPSVAFVEYVTPHVALLRFGGTTTLYMTLTKQSDVTVKRPAGEPMATVEFHG